MVLQMPRQSTVTCHGSYLSPPNRWNESNKGDVISRDPALRTSGEPADEHDALCLRPVLSSTSAEVTSLRAGLAFVYRIIHTSKTRADSKGEERGHFDARDGRAKVLARRRVSVYRSAFD